MRPQLYAILLGCAAIVLGGVVLVLNRARDTELLAAGVVAAGLAVVSACLPRGGLR
jgi:hypothetical protein